MDNEIWKDIPGHEGFYQVSNLGRVKSVDRTITQMSCHGHNVDRVIKGKIVKPTDNGNGYMVVGLRKNQVRKSVYVHRIVAELFVDGYADGRVVNHIDYDKTNNSATNLEWVSQKQNIEHSHEHYCKEKNVKRNRVGEKYISIKNGKYRLCIKKTGICFDRIFDTIGDALHMREVILHGKVNHAG